MVTCLFFLSCSVCIYMEKYTDKQGQVGITHLCICTVLICILINSDYFTLTLYFSSPDGVACPSVRHLVESSRTHYLPDVQRWSAFTLQLFYSFFILTAIILFFIILTPSVRTSLIKRALYTFCCRNCSTVSFPHILI